MTKTERATLLFIERVKLFKNKELREKTFENMDKKTQKIITNFIKKGLTLVAKKPYIIE